MTPEWVVDASVGIKLVVPEDLSSKAELALARMEEDPPVLFYVTDEGARSWLSMEVMAAR